MKIFTIPGIIFLSLTMAFSTTVNAKTYKIDISLETGPNHVRNRSMEKWATYLQEKSEGRLKVKVFHGASKYKGTNVVKALAQGALDMGAPVTVHIAKFIPEFNLPSLPLFYGASREQIYAVVDGDVGKALNDLVEKKMKVKVIGRYFDLGYGTMFFANNEIKDYPDMKGLKMRVPGGAANLKRYETFKANPIKISWPDVPQALQRGLVDGLLTTYESVRSAKLWDAGIKYTFDDFQFFFQYVPLMSKRTWDGLPKDLQDLVVSSWEEQIDALRKEAEARQASAKAEGEKHGFKTRTASPAQLKSMRQTLLAAQPGIVKELKMDAKLVQQATGVVDKAM